MISFIFLLYRFLIYIILINSFKCMYAINTNVIEPEKTDIIQKIDINKYTRSLLIKFKINDNIEIFKFTDVINSNFFLEKIGFLEFYINGEVVSNIDDEFISWSFAHLFRGDVNVESKNSNIEINEFYDDGLKQISLDILLSKKYKSKIFCNCGSKKYDFMLLDLYNTGFNLLEIKEKKCNYFSDFSMCDLSNMFSGCKELCDLHFYLRGINKIKIVNYENILLGCEVNINETGFIDICDFSDCKKFIEKYKNPLFRIK